MTTFTTLDVIHAQQLYALERELHPTLPEWERATYMTRSRFLRAARDVRAERVA